MEKQILLIAPPYSDLEISTRVVTFEKQKLLVTKTPFKH